MGASVLRNKIKKAGFTDVTVVNVAIANLVDDVDLIVTHQDLTPRARDKAPTAQHVSVAQLHEQPEVRRDRRGTQGHQRRVVDLIRPGHAGTTSVPTDRRSPHSMSDILNLSQIKTPGRGHRARTTRSGRPGRSWSTPARSSPEYIDAMFEREKSVSTYMGNLLAIPHGTNEAKDSIKSSALSVVRYENPIDWDGNEVRFAIGIAGYEGGHLEILGKVAVIFSDMDEVDKLDRGRVRAGDLRPAQRGQRGLTLRPAAMAAGRSDKCRREAGLGVASRRRAG